MKNTIKERAETYGYSALNDYDLAISLGYKGDENCLLQSPFAQRILLLSERLKRQKELMFKINRSEDVANHFKSYGLGHLQHEEFWVAYTNRANKVISTKRISIGGVAGVVADPKIILGFALEVKASALVLCHNHPSGNTTPSQQDIDLTTKIKQGALLLDLTLLDHLIICHENYFSFSDNGYLRG